MSGRTLSTAKLLYDRIIQMSIQFPFEASSAAIDSDCGSWDNVTETDDEVDTWLPKPRARDKVSRGGTAEIFCA